MLSRNAGPALGNVTPTIPIVVGATASGKTGLVMELAGRERLGGLEVVSADSRQVYRHMSIGTAKPTKEQRAILPHHVVDFLDPSDDFSAGQFRREAEGAIADVLARGNLPCVVGGTGLYLRALTEGLSAIPPVPAEVNQRLRRELASGGLLTLYERLCRVDSRAAAAIKPTDPQRTIRALAVWEATGKPLSEWWLERTDPPRYRFAWLGIRWERERLRERIQARTAAMIASGLENEVRSLLQMGYTWEMNALRTVGYREWERYTAGETTIADVAGDISTHTAQYAKRQMTWFNAVEQIHWEDASAPDFITHAEEWFRTFCAP
jgi:tRNA dimethylallyltransferase